ncbi:MAG TPA: hypothetical protein VKA21_04920 [Candidatus Binatia bacterium]|nr:hypothetical protein [Candidatus Binatia bacterium]
MANRTRGAVIAGAALALVVSGAVDASETKKTKDGEDVFCAGINACKGTGDCKGAHNACYLENACKGKGIVETTRKECREKGGKVVREPEICDWCAEDDEKPAPKKPAAKKPAAKP